MVAHMVGLRQVPQIADEVYLMWGGDFNWHHPMWEEERNHHLLVAGALREAKKLLTLIADFRMEMTLPKGLPTLEAMSTKNWT